MVKEAANVMLTIAPVTILRIVGDRRLFSFGKAWFVIWISLLKQCSIRMLQRAFLRPESRILSMWLSLYCPLLHLSNFFSGRDLYKLYKKRFEFIFGNRTKDFIFVVCPRKREKSLCKTEEVEKSGISLIFIPKYANKLQKQ